MDVTGERAVVGDGSLFLEGWGLLGECCTCLSDHVLDLRL